ncbi:MAG TPA: MDR family MFS transporter [Chloroflexota bacterium]|nr:MDR family MFS transporter [Chloroflexota bacterium]
MIAAKPRPEEAARASEASQEQVSADYSYKQVRLIYSGLALGMMLSALDQTVVATALPTVVGELGGMNHLSWVVNAYLLTSVASTLLYGKLGDLYGRKRIFQAAIGIFLLGSALSGLAQSMGELIAFRALQGIGAGGTMTLAMAIIGDVVSPRERGRYQGYNAGIFGVASIGGPLLGGLFVDHLSWRWVFYINLPIGILGVIMASLVLKGASERREHSIDYLGAALMVAAVTSLLLLTTWGGTQYAWTSPIILGLGCAAIICGTLFVLRERRAVEPILPLELFKSGVFRVATLGTMCIGMLMFGATIFLPVFLQLVSGISATNSGALLTPLMLGMICTSFMGGRFISKTGRYKILPIFGFSACMLAYVLMSTMTADTNEAQVTAYMVLLGLGIGLIPQVLTTSTQNEVPQRHLGSATSGLQFFRSMGASLGVALFGAILNSRIAFWLPRLLPPEAAGTAINPADIQGSPGQLLSLPPAVRMAVIDTFARSLHWVFLACVPIAVAGLILAFLLEEKPLRKTAWVKAIPAAES